MSYKYHKNARTTVEIRKEIKRSNLSTKELAEKYNVHPNTVRKWKKRSMDDLEDRSHATGVKSYTLSEFERMIIAEVKRVTLFSIDDLLQILKPFIPNLNKDNLYITLKQKGLNRNELILPEKETKQKPIKKFKKYNQGYIHVDVKYLPKIKGDKKYLFVSIDRKTRLAFIKIYDNKSAKSAEDFLENITNFYPFKINKILTDNGKEFTDKFRPNTDFKPTGKHIFDQKCKKHKIEHRLTKPRTPKTNGMVERMNRRIEDKVLKKIRFDNYKDLKNCIIKYINDYNLYIKQKSLDYKSPVDFLKFMKKYKNWKYPIPHNQKRDNN